jgi:hypothetical protein
MISTAGLASGCSQLPCPGQKVEAFSLGDLNPLKWLGNAASAAVGDVWLAAMTGLWSAALCAVLYWLQVIDAFTTPTCRPAVRWGQCCRPRCGSAPRWP